MENPATGLVEFLRYQHAAGRPMPPFVLFDRHVPLEALYDTLKSMAERHAAQQPVAVP